MSVVERMKIATGNCAASALWGCETLQTKYGIDLPDIRVVHGLVTGTGGGIEGVRYGHAWVEYEGIAFDFAQGGDPVSVPVETYYAVGQIDPLETVRYSVREARRLAVQHRHYGPWDDYLYNNWLPEGWASAPEHEASQEEEYA